jgi:ferredoxin
MTLTPAQAFYFGLPGNVLFALVLLVAVILFVVTASRRVQLLLIGAGAPDDRFDHPFRRLWHVVEYGILQRKMWRDPYAGLYHILIFSGFVVLLLRTIALVLEGLSPASGLPFLSKGFWETYLFLKDVILVTTLAGVLLALGRRHLFRKERLDPSFDADLILGLIGFLMATDLFAGAARFNMSGADISPFEPVTAALSGFLAGSSPETLWTIYAGCWWSHLIAILVFLNYLPFAKHFHVLTALPNLLFAKLDAPGRMSTIDIEKAAEAGVFGVSKIEDFTWKQKLDIFTCTECGRCREICPTHLTGKPLTPKGFTVDLRHALYTDAPASSTRPPASPAGSWHRRSRSGSPSSAAGSPRTPSGPARRAATASTPARWASPTPTRSPTFAGTSSSSGASSRRRRRPPSTGWSGRGTRGTSPPPTAAPGRRSCRSPS